jgi:hypothetical protein
LRSARTGAARSCGGGGFDFLLEHCPSSIRGDPELGKTGVFCHGLMLEMVTNDTLYFRVADDIRRMVIWPSGASCSRRNSAKLSLADHAPPLVVARS